MKRLFLNTPAMLALMALALALFQRAGALLPALAGALLFGGLAVLRPDLGLLFVPLAAPLYLMPAVIPSLRADPAAPLRLPAYEIALLLVCGATAANWLWRRVSTTDHPFDRAQGRRPPTADLQELSPALERSEGPKNQEPKSASDEFRDKHHATRITNHVSLYAPHLLFLLAGALGVVVAAEPSRALREFRWLIVEPLLFYMLLKSQIASRKSQVAGHKAENQNKEYDDTQHTTHNTEDTSQFSILNSQFFIRIVTAFAIGGALVGVIGLLQFAGLDLAGLFGSKQCFAASGAPCDNVVVTGGVRRATSVYGHPNNLGLYLGRVWPLAAALAITVAKNKEQKLKSLFFALCSLLCLGGIAVSFSRGAWLAAVAALAILALTIIQTKGTRHTAHGTIVPFTFYLLPLLLLVVVVGLALSLRGDVTAGSTPPRLLLWREAVGYIRRYPLGIGLDQFGFYHDPSYDRSLIDPALVDTSEQYAAHPHNLLLDIWLRLGPLGLVAFGWLLARFFRRGLRMVRAGAAPLALGALAAMVAALAHGLVDNFYFVPDLALAFWLLIVLAEA
jgi:O-antigen ligase